MANNEKSGSKKAAKKYIMPPLPEGLGMPTITSDATRVNTAPVKKKQIGNYKKIDSTKADIFRNIVFPIVGGPIARAMPSNVRQLAAKLTGDARMSNSSLSDQQKVMLWDVIQQAMKRNGTPNGGTVYQDYEALGMGSGKQYDDWFNHGSFGVVEGAISTATNPGFVLGSTVGRGNYFTDPENPKKIYYTDVYDWNPGEKMFNANSTYKIIRNALRKNEDQNLNVEKNNNYRMNFEFDADEIEKLRKSLGPNYGTTLPAILPEHLENPGEYIDKGVKAISDTFFPKEKNGGWLEKYNDGGPVQENYNDYSVTVPPNYKGEGYFNEGRDYSPAWGGQFEDGGELPQFKPGGKAKPIIVTNPKDRRLKAYNDSLTAYNITQKAIDFVKNSDIKTINDRNKVRNNPVVNVPLHYKNIDPTHWEFAKPKAVNEISKYEILIPGYKKPTQPVIYQKPKPTPQSTIDWLEGNGYSQDFVPEITPVQPTTPGLPFDFVEDPRSHYMHRYNTKTGELEYPFQGGQTYVSPKMAEGGPIKKFLQPTQTFMNLGYNPKENGLSTEYSTSIGGPGEVYLVPGFKQGRLVDPEAMFNLTGEHLGGPFKTVKAAEDFAQLRHKYVEQNKNIPAPFKTRDYAMGGNVNMPTIKDKGSFNKDGVWIPDWKAMAAEAKKLGAKKVKTDRGGVIYFNDKWEAVSADDSDNMAMGGSIGGATQGIPGATGFMYSRDSGSTPSNGKYAKKTMASAQDGKDLPKVTTTKFLPPEIKPDEEVTKPEPTTLEPLKTIILNPIILTPEEIAKQEADIKTWYEESIQKATDEKERQELASQLAEIEKYSNLDLVKGSIIKDADKKINQNKFASNELIDYYIDDYHSIYDLARTKDISPSDVSSVRQKMAEYVNSPLYAKRQANYPETYSGESLAALGIDESEFQNTIAREKRNARLKQFNDTTLEIVDDDVTDTNFYSPTQNKISLSKLNDVFVAAHETGHSITHDPFIKDESGELVKDEIGKPLVRTNVSQGSDKYNSEYFYSINSKDKDLNSKSPSKSSFSLNQNEINKFIDYATPTYGQIADPHYDKSYKLSHHFANEQYGDLQAFREMLHKYGITKSYGEDIDKDKVDKALQNKNITTHPNFKRFYQRYGSKGIIELNNTIAANNPQQGMPMAQNGMEMKYYQDGLDFKPKSISKNGKKVIKDDMGQWAHPGEITEIDSNQITMQGVPYPVLGISDTGDTQMMYPNQEYQYDGSSVTEYPIAQNGGSFFDTIKAVGNYVLNKPDSNAENIAEIFDPTGVSSWDDVYRSINNPKDNLFDTGLEIAGAFPLGKLSKITKPGIHLTKYKGIDKTLYKKLPRTKAANNTVKGIQAVGRTSDAYQAYDQYEQGGQLTKLDQLTNFTNYNTKQPGGWLDKYQ